MPPVATSNRPTWIVAIAASAGGIPAIEAVLRDLPSNLPAAILIVMHMQRTRMTTDLARIFARQATLPVTEVEQGEPLFAGHVYVARPDFHLTMSGTEHIVLTKDPPVNFVRPAADFLFNSVAERFGKFSIAVVLTGTGKDGALGAAAVSSAGGIVIAQDEATSQYYSMPHAAAQAAPADYILPLDRIPEKLTTLMMTHERD